MLLRDGDNKASRELWAKRHGEGYYVFPDNWKEIEEREFYGWFTQEPILCMENRTLQRNKDGNFAKNFTKGTAIMATLFWVSYSEGIAVEPPRFVGEKPRYFRFGCHHNWNTETVGKNFVRNTCSKCGQVNSVDSGD